MDKGTLGIILAIIGVALVAWTLSTPGDQIPVAMIGGGLAGLGLSEAFSTGR